MRPFPFSTSGLLGSVLEPFGAPGHLGVRATFIQVVPRMNPGHCGVSDYSLLLAEMWQTEHRVSTVFVAYEGHGESAVSGFPVHRCGQHQKTLQAAVADSSRIATRGVVFLHYAGYGYAPSGDGGWLGEVLRSVEVPAITVFHELYALGWPWQRAFWYTRRQKRAVLSVASASRRVATTRVEDARWLSAQGIPGSIVSTPVFSNVGEVSGGLAPDRGRTLVIWCSNSYRRRLYAHDGRMLRRLCAALGSDAVVDVGGLGYNGDIPRSVTALGHLEAGEVSQLLARAKVGIVGQDPRWLAKSGVFAAYCAHGVMPVVAGDGSADASELDGLVEDRHFMRVSSIVNARGSVSEHAQVGIATNAAAWYRPHNLAAHAATLSALGLNP